MNKSIGWLLGGMLILTGCSMPYSYDADGNFYSQVPLAEKYPGTMQKKMQAGHHWNVLAQMEGDRILEALEGDKAPLHVAATIDDKISSTFRESFQDLLTSYLVTKGKVVLIDNRLAKLNGAYTVQYKVHVLRHQGRDYLSPALWNPKVQAVAVTAIGAAAGYGIGKRASTKRIQLHKANHGWNPKRAGVLAGIGTFLGMSFKPVKRPAHMEGRLTRNTKTELLVTTQVHHEDRLLVSNSQLYYLNNGDVVNYIDIPEEVAAPLAPSTGIKVVNVD